MTAPRYALLTESLARKMKADALNKIIEEAIGIDLHPADYRNRNTEQRIKSLYMAKASYWDRKQEAQQIPNAAHCEIPPVTKAARPEILPAAEINAWLRTLPEVLA
jgi:hypothetical protein